MTTSPRIKLFIAILAQPSVDPQHTANLLAEVFGSFDYVGSQLPFNCTQYYQEEMGSDLVRWLISFTGPHYADILPGAKRACIELERGCAISSTEGASDGSAPHGSDITVAASANSADYKRTINLDIGYLDRHKVVLASTKEAGHKIYLDDGIYADLVTRYSNKTWQSLPWCFPDIADGRYNRDLSAIRDIFMRQASE
ncbi:MAG: DUF4416 family protein [Pseudomonadota bacterium]|jgi:hypothetical protein